MAAGFFSLATSKCPPGSSTVPSPRDPFGSDHARAISHAVMALRAGGYPSKRPATKPEAKPEPAKHDARVISPELGERVGTIAARLIELDPDLARELIGFLLDPGACTRLWNDLGTMLGGQVVDTDDAVRGRAS